MIETQGKSGQRFTTGDLAEMNGVPRQTVEYIIGTRKIRFVERMRGWRLYDAQAAELVGRAVEQIRAKRDARNGQAQLAAAV